MMPTIHSGGAVGQETRYGEKDRGRQKKIGRVEEVL